MTSPAGLLEVSPVIPVVTIDDPDHAVPVARALLAGGIPIIEVTLRTGRALEALAMICADVPEILAGAGTVRTCSRRLKSTAPMGWVRFATTWAARRSSRRVPSNLLAAGFVARHSVMML